MLPDHNNSNNNYGTNNILSSNSGQLENPSQGSPVSRFTYHIRAIEGLLEEQMYQNQQLNLDVEYLGNKVMELGNIVHSMNERFGALEQTLKGLNEIPQRMNRLEQITNKIGTQFLSNNTQQSSPRSAESHRGQTSYDQSVRIGTNNAPTMSRFANSTRNTISNDINIPNYDNSLSNNNYNMMGRRSQSIQSSPMSIPVQTYVHPRKETSHNMNQQYSDVSSSNYQTKLASEEKLKSNNQQQEELSSQHAIQQPSFSTTLSTDKLFHNNDTENNNYNNIQFQECDKPKSEKQIIHTNKVSKSNNKYIHPENKLNFFTTNQNGNRVLSSSLESIEYYEFDFRKKNKETPSTPTPATEAVDRRNSSCPSITQLVFKKEETHDNKKNHDNVEESMSSDSSKEESEEPLLNITLLKKRQLIKKYKLPKYTSRGSLDWSVPKNPCPNFCSCSDHKEEEDDMINRKRYGEICFMHDVGGPIGRFHKNNISNMHRGIVKN